MKYPLHIESKQNNQYPVKEKNGYKTNSLLRVLLSLSLIISTVSMQAQLTVTINQLAGQSDPAVAGTTVLYDVVFSSPINAATFTASDIDLSASTSPGLSTPVITQISPTDFHVSVTTSAAGTVVLTIPAAKTIYTSTNVGALPGNASTINIHMAFDAAGNLWVPNLLTNNVTEISPAGTVIGLFAAGTMPISVAINATTGNVYIANHVIPGTVTELSSTGVFINTYPIGTAADDGIAINQTTGNVYVTQHGGGGVYEMSATGTIIGGPYPTVQNSPQAIFIDQSTGNFWVTDVFAHNAVTEFNAAGTVLASYITGPNCFGVVMDALGNVYTVSQNANIVNIISGGIVSIYGTTGAGSFPQALTIDATGYIFTADVGNGKVTMITPAPTSVSLTIATLPTNGPIDIIADACDNIYVADMLAVYKLVPNGIALSGNCYPVNLASTSTDNMITLPVKLTSFTGTIAGCSATLRWASSNETNFSSYQAQQSIDGANYSSIATIAGNNMATGSSYSYVINSLIAGANYFRLKMTDHDGKYTYSNAIVLQSHCDGGIIALPNPTNDMITISGLKGINDIIITNVAGQQVNKVQSKSATQQISLGGFPRGIYILSVKKGDDTISNLRVVRE